MSHRSKKSAAGWSASSKLMTIQCKFSANSVQLQCKTVHYDQQLRRNNLPVAEPRHQPIEPRTLCQKGQSSTCDWRKESVKSISCLPTLPAVPPPSCVSAKASSQIQSIRLTTWAAVHSTRVNTVYAPPSSDGMLCVLRRQ